MRDVFASSRTDYRLSKGRYTKPTIPIAGPEMQAQANWSWYTGYKGLLYI